MSCFHHTHLTPSKPARVVIVGAGGFIGNALSHLLQKEEIDFLSLKKEDLNCLDPNSSDKLSKLLRPTDALVILATVTPSKERGIYALTKNITIAENICKAIEKQKVGHIIYLSADPVYSMESGVISESSPANATDIYGVMHLAREHMFKSFSTSIPVAILRSTLVYGSGDPHNSYGPNRLRRMAVRENKISLFGQGEEKRDHIFIDDVALLILKTLQHTSSGILNLATGISISYLELANKIALQFKKPIEIITHPRTGPVAHRHFSPLGVFKAFPDFTFTSLDEGLAVAHAKEFKNI